MKSIREGGEQMRRNIFYFCKRIGIVPNHPREIDLFVLGLTFLILFFIENSLVKDLYAIMNWASESPKGGSLILLVGIFLLVSPLTIYTALTKRKIGPTIKKSLSIFYIVMNIGLAVALAFYVFRSPTISNTILGVWQILRAVTLFIFSGRSAGDFYIMPTRNAYRGELILATITLACIAIIGLQKDWYWAVTFSVVLFWWQMIESFIIRHPVTRAMYRAK